MLDDYGKDFAKKYYNANQEAIDNIEKNIKEENIDCDFKRTSAYVFTEEAKELQKIKDEVNTVKAIGGDARFVLQIEPKIEKQEGAIEFPNQAEFNPRKYVKALVKKILENGGEIYQNSTVIDIKQNGEDYKVLTENGVVKAKYVVIATGYPIKNFPGFYFIKMYQEASYLIAIETNEKTFDRNVYKA